jgi:glycosyltransferase involved in cell wall biosynthesis
MRVVHVSVYDDAGGAARSASRLHQGLCQLGQDSRMYVGNRVSDDPHVLLHSPSRRFGDRLRQRVRQWWYARQSAPYQRTRAPGMWDFTDDRTGYGSEVVRALPACDVLNLHWIAGFLDPGAFFSCVARDQRVVWTLHDMNPITGGCYFTNGCDRHLHGCGRCPQLGSTRERDLSRRVWQRKRVVFGRQPSFRLRLVTPSRWLKEEVGRSPFFAGMPISVIPYGVDTDMFTPRDRAAARVLLGIPAGVHVILFLAHSFEMERKGMPLLLEALQRLADVPGLFLLSAGLDRPPLDAVRLPFLHMGRVPHDWMLSVLYSAADVLVVPSLEDNLPNAVIEAMACGLAVVGFDVGGVPDLIRPGLTGLLAQARDVQALADAVRTVLSDDGLRRAMGQEARRVAVASCGLKVQARGYLALYEEMAEVANG